MLPAPAPCPSLQDCNSSPDTNLLPAWPACSTKELLHSRAYLRFKDAADVPRFQQAWDGHAFVNERGTQFRWVGALTYVGDRGSSRT